MASYGNKSEGVLATCSAAINMVFREVVKRFDNSANCGKRTPDEQAELVARGASKTMNSKHIPLKEDGSYDPDGLSDALDSFPYPNEWPDEAVLKSVLGKIGNDEELKHYIKAVAKFYYMGGYVLATGDAMGIALRWGGDWDGDRDIHDQTFDDLVHFEEKKGED